MGTIPTPPTATPGNQIPAAHNNALRDCINFWAGPPQCYAYRSSNLSTTNNAWTVAGLNAEVFDVVQSGDTASHDNSTNPSRIYARTTGKYEISGSLMFSSNATGARGAQVRLNAAGSDVGGTELALVQIDATGNSLATAVAIPTVVAPLTAGDYIEAFGFQSSGGALDLLSGQGRTFLRFRLIAA